MNPGLKQLSLVLLLACTVFLAPPGTATASAKGPACWQLLLNDWYDGHIDKTYPIPCYREAIAHLPTDVQVYSSAREDIQRALQQAIRAQEKPGTTVPRTTTTKVGTTTTTRTTTTRSGQTTTTTAAETTTTVVTTPASTNGRKKKKGVVGALDKLNPGSANSFPLPLLILGALAVVLILAGIGGMIWRRYQT